MIDLKPFIAAKKGLPWTYRIKMLEQERATQWSRFLVIPKEGFIESYMGPVLLQNVHYVEINPYEVRYMGRLEQDKRFNHSDEIEALLTQLEIPYSMVEQYIRITLNEAPLEEEDEVNGNVDTLD
jgi:hypothetical protein